MQSAREIAAKEDCSKRCIDGVVSFEIRVRSGMLDMYKPASDAGYENLDNIGKIRQKYACKNKK